MIQFFIALFLSFPSWAQTYVGSSLSGHTSLSGLLKAAVIKNALPFGSVSGIYGYSIFDFSTLEKPNKKSVYCFGGVSYNGDNSLIGISFGGEYEKYISFDQCQKPEDFSGGFLSIGIGYEATKGSKSSTVKANLNIGFDLNNFTTILIRNFNSQVLSTSTPHMRLKNLIRHLVIYAGKSKVKQVIGAEINLLKILMLPLAPVLGENFNEIIQPLFGVSEQHFIQDLKTSYNKTLKTRISQLIYKIRRDAELYNCYSNLDCSQVTVDVLYLFDAITSSLGDCHSLSVNVSLDTSYTMTLPFINVPFRTNFAYTYYGLNKNLNSSTNTELLASKYFAGHHFLDKAPICDKVSDYGAQAFGQYLSLISL